MTRLGRHRRWLIPLLFIIGAIAAHALIYSAAPDPLVYVLLLAVFLLPTVTYGVVYPIYRATRWLYCRFVSRQALPRSSISWNVWAGCVAFVFVLVVVVPVIEGSREHAKQARIAQAKADVQTLSFAVKRYEAHMEGRLPGRLEALTSLTTNGRGQRMGPFLERVPQPPHGYSPYHYERHGSNGFSVSTSGDKQTIEDRRPPHFLPVFPDPLFRLIDCCETSALKALDART